MFCPRCGTTNPDGSRFCEGCGNILENNTAPAPEQQYAPPATNPDGGQQPKPDVVINIPKVDTDKVKNTIMAKKGIIIPIAAVLLAFIVFIGIGSSLSSPEKVVKSYFQALTESDYDAMYNYMALPDSELVSEEAFAAFMESKWTEEGNPYQGITNFDVQDITEEYSYLNGNREEERQNPVRTYLITSVDKMTGDTKSFTVDLIEQDTKTLLFFDNYKVSSAGYISRNVRLYVDVPAQVTLDGVTLAEPTINEDGYSIYTIEAIFRGDHTLQIVSDLFEPYETSIYFYGDDSEEEVDAKRSMELKENILTTLETKAGNDVKTMYANALAQKPFSADMIKTSPLYTDLSSRYNSLTEHLRPNEDGEGVNSMRFTEAKMYSSYGKPYSIYTDDNGNMAVSFTMSFAYDYTATSYDYWDDEYTKNDRSSNASVNVNYAFINGEWVLENMSDCNFYFYY